MKTYISKKEDKIISYKENTEHKKINLNLVGIDGNAFAIMGAFQKQAKREDWTQEEINTVLDEAKSGDYDNLLQTIMKYCDDSCRDDDNENVEDECPECNLSENECECNSD